ncbi:LytTR family DNA-binding domain-containing protein [Maricaulis sp. CAU 1757]
MQNSVNETGKPPSDLQRDQASDRAAWRDATALGWLVLLVVWIILASSVETEMERAGVDTVPLFGWVMEGSSIVVSMALLPAMTALVLRVPPEPGRLALAVPVHLVAVVVFSLVHVTAMTVLRMSIWEYVYRAEYTYLNEPVGDFIYEFRKDAGAYLGFVLMTLAIRQLHQYRLELAAARREARQSHRLTLKCGGRTVHVEAERFEHARAAGNYVEVRLAGGGEHLARMTLAELERQLVSAGVDAVRVHRSWLVERGAITETRPTGEGDLTITLASGQQVPGSRRFRGRLEAG